MNEPNNRVKLLRKIFRVMKAIPELVKTGVMQEGDAKQYGYHEADSIREAFRTELLRQRLLCLPRAVDYERWGNPTSTGGTFNYCLQKIQFSFLDIDTGEELQCESIGIGGDSLDRNAPKAAIQALKYFLTNGFFVKGIELDGDDPAEQLAGREANRQHQEFLGRPDAIEVSEDYAWAMIDGVRLFADAPKMKTKLKKILKDYTHMGKLGEFDTSITNYPVVKFRTYMGTINGGVNPHPLIDKIEVIANEKPLSAASEVPSQEAEPSAWPGDSLR